MPKSTLNIIKIDENSMSNKKNLPSRRARLKEFQAKFERLWLVDPEAFNPLRNCMEKERLERSWNLLKTHVELKQKLIADIGCAAGIFTKRLWEAGGQITAVDTAENALKHLRQQNFTNITIQQGTMPDTPLLDNHYDVIVCMDVIAFLPVDDHRLFFSELSRLIKPQGYVLCSTPIDIYTEGGAQRLIDLAHSEFNLVSAVISYHALYIRLKHFFNLPHLFVQGAENEESRKKEIHSRSGFSKKWYKMNASYPFAYFWKLIRIGTRPCLAALKNKRSLLLSLEKICRFFLDEAGISHFIFLAQKRPLEMTEEIPINRPKKHEIWE